LITNNGKKKNDGQQCYDLNMKDCLQNHVLNDWSQNGGAILEGGRNFRRWDLAGGRGQWG
jgi:hypothetical protein